MDKKIYEVWWWYILLQVCQFLFWKLDGAYTSIVQVEWTLVEVWTTQMCHLIDYTFFVWHHLKFTIGYTF